MKQFALEGAEVLVVNVNPRREKHGKAKVPAVDVRVKLTLANSFLDQLRPELRGGLFTSDKPDDVNQADLDGVAPASDTPHVRIRGMAPVHLEDELTGYAVTFDIGTGRKESLLELGGCKLNSFAIEPIEGGSATIDFRIQAAHVTKRDYGELCMMIDSTIGLHLEPPTESQATLDGAGEAPAEEGEDPEPSRMQKAITRAAKKAPAKKARK